MTDPDWSQLKDARGTAEHVPALLDRVSQKLDSPAWTDLWGRLCHQGTVYPASFAALPLLTRIAQGWPPGDRVRPLVLAGAIVSSGDQPYGNIDAYVEHATEIAALAALTEEAMTHPGVTAEPGTYVYLLEALLTFEGVQVWPEALDGLNDDEYEVPCPECETENFIAFGEYGTFSTADRMYMTNTSTKRLPLLAADPTSLAGFAKRLHSRVAADGQREIAEKLTYVFGGARCANCDAVFRVDQAIVASWID